MSKDRALICASVSGACLLSFVLLLIAVGPLISAPQLPSASPPPLADDRPLNYGRESDGFPLETTKGQALVNACARAHHVNPFGTITAKQAEEVATCVDRIRSGRVTLN